MSYRETPRVTLLGVSPFPLARNGFRHAARIAAAVLDSFHGAQGAAANNEHQKLTRSPKRSRKACRPFSPM